MFMRVVDMALSLKGRKDIVPSDAEQLSASYTTPPNMSQGNQQHRVEEDDEELDDWYVAKYV
jgi:hypothetical protein